MFSKQTGMRIGIVTTGAGILLGSILLIMLGALVIAMESNRE